MVAVDPDPDSRAPLISVRALRYAYDTDTPVLDIPAFELQAGETLFLRGASGSGKSTLLGLIAGVLAPQAGSIEVLGQDLGRLGGAARDALRADAMGVIFQLFNLVPYLSVIDNVLLPCRFSSARRVRAEADAGSLTVAAEALLARLELEPALVTRPVRSLSVGQQQRVAAARALIGGPELVIADEPTSALDDDRRDAFMRVLMEAVRATGAGLLFVSHDQRLAGHFQRAVPIEAINRLARDHDAEAFG